MTTELIDQLIQHEGLRLHPYKDSLGILTIGVGRNLEDKGITKEEAMVLLDGDINEAVTDCVAIFPNWYNLSQQQRYAIIDMRFNLGPSRFRGFKKFIHAVKTYNIPEAKRQMKDSKWYTQVGLRADELMKQIGIL